MPGFMAMEVGIDDLQVTRKTQRLPIDQTNNTRNLPLPLFSSWTFSFVVATVLRNQLENVSWR